MKIKALYLFILLSLFNVLAGKKKHNPVLLQQFKEMSLNVHHYTEDVVVRLALLKDSLSVDEQEQYRAYFWQIGSYAAFSDNDYQESIALIDSAMAYFVTYENPEWEARCLLLLANLAEGAYLIDEASKAFSLVVELSTDPAIKGAASLGLGRCQKRSHKDWKNSFSQGCALLQSTSNSLLHLYVTRNVFWFYPDSCALPSELNRIALSYKKANLPHHAANSYKGVAIYYQDNNQLDSTLIYIEQSIDIANSTYEKRTPLFISLIYVKAQALQLKGFNEEAMSLFQYCIALSDSIGNSEANYYDYLYLSRYKKEQKDYISALEYSEEARKCTLLRSKRKVEMTRIIARQFYKRDVLSTQLETIKAQSNLKLIIIFLVFLLLLSLSVGYLFNRHKRLKLKSICQQQDNVTLTKINSDLLYNINRKNFEQKINKGQHKLEREIKKRLSPNSEFKSKIERHYLDYYLNAKVSLIALSDKELECAILLMLELSSEEIANIMMVTKATILTYRTRIRKKLNVKSTKERKLHSILKEMSDL